MHSITDRVGRTSVPRHHAPGLLRPDPADRLLVLAPHPDDESLAIGGLLRLARAVGASVRVIYLTSGENNPWAQRACERRWRVRRSSNLKRDDDSKKRHLALVFRDNRRGR